MRLECAICSGSDAAGLGGRPRERVSIKALCCSVDDLFLFGRVNCMNCEQSLRRMETKLVIMRRIVLAGCLTLLIAACSRPASVSEPPKTESTLPAIDACLLLSAEEIAAAQGAPPQSTTPGARDQSGMSVAQCYFALARTADSLNLIVQRKAPGAGAQTPATMWRDMFHNEEPPKVGRDGKLKEKSKPAKIEGLGDEAFWAGGQFGGMLHVLKGETVIQISVGGPGEEAAKLEKLKELAKIILQRLG